MGFKRGFCKDAGAALLAAWVLLSSSCSSNTAKGHYIMAEKMWNDGSYAAAVAEFEKVTAKDPKGKLGLQALFRAAMTETLFLARHTEAIQKFKLYADLNPDSNAAWEAQKQIGEILYAKTEQYDLAIPHYRMLLKQRPAAPEAPEFSFRIAKSLFFRWQFKEAITAYEELFQKYPGTSFAEQSLYEIGVTYFTQGEQQPGRSSDKPNEKSVYHTAIQAFEKFLKTFPSSKWMPEAKFGIASCLEEMDLLDQAYQQYQALERIYPSPNVIKIKLARIRERKAQRSH